MKSRRQNFVMGTTRLVLPPLVLFGCLCSCALLAVAQQKEPEKLDRKDPERPFRENLPGGGYREVTTNKKRQRIQEEEYDGLGVRTKRKEINTVHPNGEEAEVEIIYYGIRDGQPGVIVKREVIKSDNKGRPTEKTTLTDYDEQKGWQTKTVTTYPPGSGPEGVSRTEKKNPKTGEYELAPSPSQPSTPGQKTTTSRPLYNPFEFYAGFSHNRVDGGDEREGFNGFATSFTGNVNRYAGLKIYYSAHTKLFQENGFDFSSRATIHQGFVGVQLKDNVLEDGPVRPFAHLLAGFAHHRFSLDNGVGSFSDSRTGFAGVIGGGLDFRLNDRMDFRVQFDYNPNRIDDEWQHNVRGGFGLVFKFGGKADDDVDDDADSRDPSLAGVPQEEAEKCVWVRYNLGKDTNVTSVKSDKPTIVEVRVANLSGNGGFEYHCLKDRGTALITYKYTDANGGNQEGKLRVFCK